MDNYPASQADNTPQDKADLMLARMASIEALLVEQQKNAKKSARRKTIQLVLLVCVVLIFAVGMFSIHQSMAQTASAVQQGSTQLEVVLQNATAVDFEALNEAVQGLGSIDFEALNQSIRDLQVVAESLADLFDYFR